MEVYWHDVLKDKGVAEKMAQHQICILNTAKTDYTVIDLEYQVSKESVFKSIGRSSTGLALHSEEYHHLFCTYAVQR